MNLRTPARAVLLIGKYLLGAALLVSSFVPEGVRAFQTAPICLISLDIEAGPAVAARPGEDVAIPFTVVVTLAGVSSAVVSVSIALPDGIAADYAPREQSVAPANPAEVSTITINGTISASVPADASAGASWLFGSNTATLNCVFADSGSEFMARADAIGFALVVSSQPPEPTATEPPPATSTPIGPPTATQAPPPTPTLTPPPTATSTTSPTATAVTPTLTPSATASPTSTAAGSTSTATATATSTRPVTATPTATARVTSTRPASATPTRMAVETPSVGPTGTGGDTASPPASTATSTATPMAIVWTPTPDLDSGSGPMVLDFEGQQMTKPASPDDSTTLGRVSLGMIGLALIAGGSYAMLRSARRD